VDTDDLSLCANCDQVQIFPNPSNGEFQLTIGRNLSAPSLRVMDALGRVVESRKLAANTRALTFGQQLPTGLYFVEILDGGTRVETKRSSRNNNSLLFIRPLSLAPPGSADEWG
jgi:hypothetical protein